MSKIIKLSKGELPKNASSMLENMVNSFISKILKEFSNVNVGNKSFSKVDGQDIYSVQFRYSFYSGHKKHNESAVISVNYER
ncbi:hypothetical protein J4231_03025 [Candidatus Woesearchaeota archaeon]|nr:hypothetical protein [Candidatus Woesearchaeota archaeon]